MRKLRILCFALIALMAFMLPETAFAQNLPDSDPGPEWNIKIEFRYSKGEESKLNIPEVIARYGRNYRLIDKSDPVLEKKLPASRTYTWLIDGTLTESELHLIEGVEGVVLKPVDVEIGRVIDKDDVVKGLPTNDVEALPFSKSFEEGLLTRAAVRFDVEALDDFDLPLSYEAEIIYRGIEKYIGPGYEVTATYTTTEKLDDVPVYVIVATYAPVGLAAIAGATGGGVAGTGGQESEPVAAVEPPIDSEPEGVAAVSEAIITDEEVPQGAGEAQAGMSMWLKVLIVILAALGGAVLWMLLTRWKNIKKKRANRKEVYMEKLHPRYLAKYDS